MTVWQTVLFLFLCTAGFGEKADDSRPIWLHIDQLCGEIQFEPAYVKIGKVESLFPAPYLTNASLSLYAAGPSDKPCCGEAPIATGSRINMEISSFKDSGEVSIGFECRRMGKNTWCHCRSLQISIRRHALILQSHVTSL